MKPLAYILLMLAVVVIGCTSTKQTTSKSVFTFNYSNSTYEIVSINTPSGEGINILSQLGEEGKRFTAHDINQDGVLDIVIKGSSEITGANLIYAAGIDAAKNSGNYLERNFNRSFKWENELYTLTISSYFLSESELYNLFTITMSTDSSESMFQDFNADGILDTTDKGTFPIDRAQPLYEATLLKGIDEGRINKNEFNYFVKERRSYSYRNSSIPN